MENELWKVCQSGGRSLKSLNINGQAITATAASEAFDEPLTKAQVLAIVDPFIV